MSLPIELLLRYWQGELSAADEDRVETALFEDAATERRLQAVAQLATGIRSVVTDGRLQAVVTARFAEALERSGLTLRTYQIEPGETVPCTIEGEDFVVVRLKGTFDPKQPLDVDMSGTLAGLGSVLERYSDVPIDRASGEVVFIYPGERIRALPRSDFTYTARHGAEAASQFGLAHRPTR